MNHEATFIVKHTRTIKSVDLIYSIKTGMFYISFFGFSLVVWEVFNINTIAFYISQHKKTSIYSKNKKTKNKMPGGKVLGNYNTLKIT